MLILEGPDHVGKTVAAKRIVDLIAELAETSLHTEKYVPPARYSHMSRPNAAFDFLEDYKDLMSVYAIQDRFHLGALVWHEGVMPKMHLRIIEGWLASCLSSTVIFYVEDDEFYREILSVNPKEEMFDVDALIRANGIYRDIVYGNHIFEPRFDHSWCVTEHGVYPTEEVLWHWAEEWISTLTALTEVDP